mmetsp:Transcript_103461/g.179600  ORF Transcript_103461/g.179600 Transcript_103461/m.179600 type:complete len:938 (-) Transcript_103461:42-2855(-)
MAPAPPLANGMRLGSLAEVEGEVGQVLSYAADSDSFTVLLVNGTSKTVKASSLKAPRSVAKPGQGGSAESFDMLMGPRTPPEALAEEMSSSVFEKGFCVLKICQSTKDVEKSLGSFKDMSLSRLPEEVEEGYLGVGAAGKVMWFDSDVPITDPVLKANDHNITYLASLFQPYAEDILGKAIDERTPSLASMTLTPDEEDDYPSPPADDKVLGDFLSTWQRGLVRIVHFMGPETVTVTLDSKAGAASAALPCSLENVEVSASPNTILIYRTECYDYSVEGSGEVLTMMSTWNSARPQFEIDTYADMEGLFEGDGPQLPGDKIQIMCMATRLASKADTMDAYGCMLNAGSDAVLKIPVTRFDVDAYFCDDPDTLMSNPIRTTQMHMSHIDGCQQFDYRYFEISNAEQIGMDPLQKQVLEVGGNSMALFGITKKVANKEPSHASVSVGVDKADWPTIPGVPQGGCNAYAIIANRFSFVFNLKGTNYVADTACSASLVATHLAKYLLLERTFDPIDFHVAIGTHLTLAIGPWIGCSQSQMTAPKGRCFTFDASASGYLRGEGTSGIILKYGDYHELREGVWRASNSGQDGRSASLTAPNGPAQERCISTAMKEAKMDPPESNCWECHGTGTSLGDPIEVGSARKIQIKGTTQRSSPLMMSTAKSFCGHLEGGAAMAGICKCILQVCRNRVMPTLHTRQLNPHLEATAFTAFFSSEWQKIPFTNGHSQVSSFGFGGTNGHAIIWGSDLTAQGDMPAQIMKRLAMMKPPEVRCYGRNPDDWESDWPDFNIQPGDKVNIFFSMDKPNETRMKFEVVPKAEDEAEEEAEEEEAAADETFWCITGNFNGWTDDRMLEGDMEGLCSATVEIPSGGSLQFRFLQNGDTSKVLAPSIPNCTKRLAPIMGPAAELTNMWIVEGPAGAEVQIELLVQKDRKSVMWLKETLS